MEASLHGIRAAQVIDYLGLVPLPGEGGFYRETYRSAAAALPLSVGGSPQTGPAATRCSGTCIFYLLTPDGLSRMHRICSDEIFHFYGGDPVEMLLLFSPKCAEQSGLVRLGSDFMHGEQVQQLVPANVWQGARLVEGGSWALLGTTVSPGFEFADFELGEREPLCREFPTFAPTIRALTPSTLSDAT